MANIPYRNFLDGETFIATSENHSGHFTVGHARFDPDFGEWRYTTLDNFEFWESDMRRISDIQAQDQTPKPITHPLFTESELYTLKANMAAQIASGLQPHTRRHDLQPLAEDALEVVERILSILNCEFEDRANGGA